MNEIRLRVALDLRLQTRASWINTSRSLIFDRQRDNSANVPVHIEVVRMVMVVTCSLVDQGWTEMRRDGSENKSIPKGKVLQLNDYFPHIFGV